MSRHLLEQAKEYIENQFDPNAADLLAELQRELDVGRKYSTGNYLILRFDEFGAKIATTLSEGDGLVGAQIHARADIENGLCASAVAVHVCWNSKDRTAERWEVK